MVDSQPTNEQYPKCRSNYQILPAVALIIGNWPQILSETLNLVQLTAATVPNLYH